MTHEELIVHVKVLEARVERLTGVLTVLLETIDNGTSKQAAREMWEMLQEDLEPPQ